MTPNGINRKYGGKIRKYLRGVSKELKKRGYYVDGPCDRSDEEFCYNLLISRESLEGRNIPEDAVDIDFYICESECRDCEKGGMAFSVVVNSVGGELIGGLTPFNYSGNLWVDRNDAEAIEKRWQVIMDADVEDLIKLVEDWFEGEGAKKWVATNLGLS